MTRKALTAHKQYDAIIVPGIQFVEPAWDRVLQLRLIWAKHLYDRGLTKYIITSGAAVYTPYVESQIMAEYLVAMGVPRDRIITEERAEHSTENLWYGYKLAKKRGFTAIAVCTDPFQAKALWRFAKVRTHKEVKFLPAIFDTLRTLPHDTPVVNYAPLKVKDFVPITLKYSRFQRLKGTAGRNIDYKAE
ncbi:MAG: YdcF family protein [Bacteroidia bacterium]|nr:YdcF family protein [Bacteroidia bacterium]